MLNNLNYKTEWIRFKYKLRRFHIRHPRLISTVVGSLFGAGLCLGLVYSFENFLADSLTERDRVDRLQQAEAKSEGQSQDGQAVVLRAVPAADVAKAAEQASVVIRTQNRRGSGFFISPNLLLTNFHVIKEARKLRVRPTNSRREFEIEEVVGFNEDYDLILLRTKQESAGWLPLAKSESVVIGDKVYAYGAPKGIEGTFTVGILSNKRRRRGVRVFQVSAPISSGSSGGPVLNSEGEVIGVSTAIVKGGQNLNVVMPIANVTTLLARQVLSGEDLPQAMKFRPHFSEYCSALSQINLTKHRFREVKKNDLVSSARGKQCQQKVGTCTRSVYKESESLQRYVHLSVKLNQELPPNQFMSWNQRKVERFLKSFGLAEDSFVIHSMPSQDILDLRGFSVSTNAEDVEVEKSFHIAASTGCELTVVAGVKSHSRALVSEAKEELNKLSGVIERQLNEQLPDAPKPDFVMAWQHRKVASEESDDDSERESVTSGSDSEFNQN
jgi:serine protease Do